MRKLLLITLFSAFAFAATAQSIVPAATDVTVNGTTAEMLLDTNIAVTNSSGSSIDVRVKRVEVSTVAGSSNNFCWKNCYPPSVSVSEIISIGAGETVYNFIADYKPQGNAGTSVIKYVFYDDQNPTDSSEITVTFAVTPTSLKENDLSADASKAFPNPASGEVTFRYQFNEEVEKLVLRDVLGKVIREVEVGRSAGDLRVGLTGVPGGVYFYSFTRNGKSTPPKKLIIR